MRTSSLTCEYSLEDMLYLLAGKKIELGIARERGQGERSADLAMEIRSLERAIDGSEPCNQLLGSFEYLQKA